MYGCNFDQISHIRSFFQIQNDLLTKLNLVQLLDQESLISTMRGADEKYSGEFHQLSQELDESKEEVSELMRALEDLALNYDQKAEALQGKIKFQSEFYKKILCSH